MINFNDLWEQTTGLPVPVDKNELDEAISYFHFADKHGWSTDLDDKTDQEIIDMYYQALKSEYSNEE